MPDCSISFGIDASGMIHDLKIAQQTFESGMDKMVGSTNRLDGAHDKLLKSSGRVAHQMANFARTLTSGADAAEILSVGLEGIGRSLNASIGVLAGLYIGGMIVGQITKASAAVTKLHNEIQALGAQSTNARFESLQQLNTLLGEIHHKMGEIKEAWPQPSKYVTFRQIFSVLAHPIDSLTGQPEKDEASLRSSNKRVMQAQADRAARDNREQEYRDSGPSGGFKAERMKAMDELNNSVREGFSGRNLALVAEAHRKYADTMARIKSKEDDGGKLTLAELAREGADSNTAGVYGAGPGFLARKAMAEQEMARDRALRGDLEGSNEHMKRAQEIKNGIGVLKDSEKDMTLAVKNGFDQSTKIETLIQAVKGISFKRGGA